MPVNKCLLQPNHPWHAGHTTAIGPIDPRALYAARMRRKDAGARAWRIVREASDPHREWGPKIAMTDLQKFFLLVVIKGELLATNLLPIGGYVRIPPRADEVCAEV